MRGTEPRTTPLYRSLHGAPMIGGVPAPLALVLLGVGAVAGFGVMLVSKLGGVLVVLGIALLWAGLAFIYAQDRVFVPLVLLRLRHRFAARITSYSPGPQTVRGYDDEETKT